MIRRAFKLFMFASAIGLGGMIAWGTFHETVTGSGVPATEERSVGAVTEVILSGVGNLTVVQGEVPGLSVTADDNVLPLLETETSGRKLTIGTKTGYSIRANPDQLHPHHSQTGKAEHFGLGQREGRAVDRRQCLGPRVRVRQRGLARGYLP